MPTYRQDETYRECGACDEEIRKGEMMMDFFRQLGGPVTWVHEQCIKKAMEGWLMKKADKKRLEALERGRRPN